MSTAPAACVIKPLLDVGALRSQHQWLENQCQRVIMALIPREAMPKQHVLSLGMAGSSLLVTSCQQRHSILNSKRVQAWQCISQTCHAPLTCVADFRMERHILFAGDPADGQPQRAAGASSALPPHPQPASGQG